MVFLVVFVVHTGAQKIKELKLQGQKIIKFHNFCHHFFRATALLLCFLITRTKDKPLAGNSLQIPSPRSDPLMPCGRKSIRKKCKIRFEEFALTALSWKVLW